MHGSCWWQRSGKLKRALNAKQAPECKPVRDLKTNLKPEKLEWAMGFKASKKSAKSLSIRYRYRHCLSHTSKRRFPAQTTCPRHSSAGRRETLQTNTRGNKVQPSVLPESPVPQAQHSPQVKRCKQKISHMPLCRLSILVFHAIVAQSKLVFISFMAMLSWPTRVNYILAWY